MQIIKNIYQLAGNSFGTVTNMYAIKGKDEVVLIEGGGSDDLEVAKKTMKYWGLTDLPITHVFITHSHADHSGNAHIYRELGAKIVAVSGDAEAIENGNDCVIDYGPFCRQRFVPCPVDIKPKDGDNINAAGIEIKVIHVPGHTSGSNFFKYVAEDGRVVLFTGDIVGAGYKEDFRLAKFFWSAGSDYDRKIFFESLKRIKDLEADIILPSHGEKILENGWKILKSLYLRALLDWRGPHPRFDGYKYD